MSKSQNPITDERTLQMLRTAFGMTITQALDEDKVIEIMVNPDGKIWLDKLASACFIQRLNLLLKKQNALFDLLPATSTKM